MLIHKIATRYLRAGLFRPPPAMVKTIFNWARLEAASFYLWKNENAMKELSAEMLRETKGLEIYEQVLDFTSRFFKPSSHLKNYLVNQLNPRTQAKMEKWISLAMVNAQLRLQSRPDSTRIRKMEFQLNLKDWYFETPPERDSIVKVTLDFKGGVAGGGYDRSYKWDDSSEQHHVLFVLPNEMQGLEEWDQRQKELMVAIDHELIHVGQRVLSLLKEKQHHLYLNQENSSAGFPSRNIQDRGVDQKAPTDDKARSYVLDDREFYALLSSYSKGISELLYKIPERFHKDIFLHITAERKAPHELKDYLREITKSPQWYHLMQMQDPIVFFSKLKNHNRAKYQKAVKELYKELRSRGASV